MTSVPKSGMHLSSLQYLRGIAALAVVYFHAVVQVGQVANIHTLPMSGSFGVDIFFVLSGFVMWWTTKDRKVGIGDFLVKRLIRIAPLYWVLTLVAAAIALFFGDLLRSTKFDLPHLGFSLLFLPYWNPAVSLSHPEVLTPVIVPGWTLNTEMMFYALFACALAVRQTLRPLIVAVLLGLVYVSAKTWLSGTTAAFYGTDRLAEFMAGILLACTIRRIPLLSPTFWTLLGLAAFAVLFWMDYDRPSISQFIVLGIPAIFLLCAALQIELSGNLPDLPKLSLLGDASYSIYLSHIFVIAGTRVAAHVVGLDLGMANGAVFVLLALVVSSVAGIVVHRTIELPLLKGMNRLLRGGRKPPAAAELGTS
ncbi:acyltransferase [Sphingomonas aerolata]|uniref:acyltransferase family protein n=1 Tax=Sphingomonas aerolata TaxID=185951 RepID=UPI002FDFF384